MNDLPLPWTVSDRLLRKVTADGEMMPFYGATTVIMLSDKDRNSCLDVRDHLFGKHGDRFVALAPHTYHLTIHALSNAYNVDGDDGMIRHSIERTEPQVKTEFQRIAAQFGDRSIRMRALGVSTGGKDIIGLKFVPEAKEDCELLIDLFDRLEAVYPLGESFVPHVSLARLKGTSAHDLAWFMANAGRFQPLEFEVGRFVLFSSRDSVGGGPYIVEQGYPLAA